MPKQFFKINKDPKEAIAEYSGEKLTTHTKFGLYIQNPLALIGLEENCNPDACRALIGNYLLVTDRDCDTSLTPDRISTIKEIVEDTSINSIFIQNVVQAVATNVAEFAKIVYYIEVDNDTNIANDFLEILKEILPFNTHKELLKEYEILENEIEECEEYDE